MGSLCPLAIAVLGSIERLPDNPYVIVGTKAGQHLTDLERPWRRIRARAGLGDVRIHDLRHSFASAALVNGESLAMILGFTAIVGGFGTLVWRLRPGDDEDDDPDNGARV